MQLQLFEVAGFESVFHRDFLQSELGRLYSTIPFRALADYFRSKIKRCPQGVVGKFSIEGGLGLMFLKHHSNLSDAKLIERLNTDWHYQVFCGLIPQINQRIKDEDMVGRWRRFFGIHMDINELQSRLAQHWKADLPHLHVSMNDATVYESYIKYPTDVKLLWDCTEWVQNQIFWVGKQGAMAVPRSKFKQQKTKYISFMKQRKKTHKQERVRRRSLLYLLEKLLRQFQQLLNRGGRDLVNMIKPKVFERLKVVRTVLVQQRYHFQQPTKSVPQRIVSLYKPYIRPIVRGKENKRVEFGAKVHQMQVGGCNFIEHLNFEAFHEGNRLKQAIWRHRQFFVPVQQYAGDAIYATNRNRTYCRINGIATCFKPKGKQGADKEQADAMRRTLGTIRATVLEGSFGNEKNHYLLRKVRARTKETEIAWIFFGVHTANAVKIMHRRRVADELKKAAQQQMAA